MMGQTNRRKLKAVKAKEGKTNIRVTNERKTYLLISEGSWTRNIIDRSTIMKRLDALVTRICAGLLLWLAMKTSEHRNKTATVLVHSDASVILGYLSPRPHKLHRFKELYDIWRKQATIFIFNTLPYLPETWT